MSYFYGLCLSVDYCTALHSQVIIIWYVGSNRMNNPLSHSLSLLLCVSGWIWATVNGVNQMYYVEIDLQSIVTLFCWLRIIRRDNEEQWWFSKIDSFWNILLHYGNYWAVTGQRIKYCWMFKKIILKELLVSLQCEYIRRKRGFGSL